MLDLSKTIAPKSDQLNADDLIGGPRTITITGVKLVAEDQPVAVSFEGDEGKPWKPCKSMRRVLVKAWGSDGAKYAGKSLTLYLDESVRFGGAAVGGIRIGAMSHISKDLVMALTATRGTKKAYTVKPLAVEQPAKPQPADTTPTPDAGLVSAGNAAASDGVAMYSAWLANLDADQKSSIRHLHGGWSKVAKAADAEKHDDILGAASHPTKPARKTTGQDISMTFAKVASEIESSKDRDTLDIALDMIRLVADEQQREELAEIGRRVAAAIEAAA